MRRAPLFTAILFLVGGMLVSNAWAVAWQELKGDHFIVYFEDDKKFAKDVLKAAERYYKRIAADLGYARHSNFWQWENRVKVKIYASREAYLANVNQAGWSEGVANYEAKEIISYAWKEGFTESLLAHEIAHLIFRDYVGFKGEVPLWMDEGVAQWEESHKRELIQTRARDLLNTQDLIPLRRLMSMDIRGYKDENIVRIFYVQSAMLVGFLIEHHGADDFIRFCRSLRDGKELEEALRFSYPTKIRTMEDLEMQFKQYLEAV